MFQPNDVQRLVGIDQADHDALVGLVTQLSSGPAPTLKQLQAVVANPHTYLFCLRDDHGAIVGILCLATFAVPTGLRAWIEDVVVDASLRGQGAATALVHAANKEAIALGARTIDLTSRPSREQANRLYERLGFDRRETNVWRWSSADEPG